MKTYFLELPVLVQIQPNLGEVSFVERIKFFFSQRDVKVVGSLKMLSRKTGLVRKEIRLIVCSSCAPIIKNVAQRKKLD